MTVVSGSWVCCYARRIGRCVILLIALIASGGASTAQSASSPLPVPTGSYSVGRTHFDWTDASRAEPASPDRHREIVVWVWYPASPEAAAVPGEWLPGKWQGFCSAQLIRSKPTGGDGCEPIRTHAYPEVPLSADGKKFPVLVFAPGMSMVPLVYSSLIEDIVSHGYVVAGIVPTDYAYSVMSDGRIVPGSDPMGPVTPGQLDRKLAAVGAAWSADASFVLTQLQKLNLSADTRFHGRLDLEHVGIFGHSQGGTTSLLVGKNDARVHAILVLDGMLPQSLATGAALPKPILLLRSDLPGFPAGGGNGTGGPPGPQTGPPPMGTRSARADAGAPHNGLLPPPPMNPLMNFDPVLRSATPGYNLKLSGSLHPFSSDLAVLNLSLKGPPGVRPMPTSGSIDPVRALAVTEAYVEAFFDQYLRGAKSTLLSGPSAQYPEVEFQRMSPQ